MQRLHNSEQKKAGVEADRMMTEATMPQRSELISVRTGRSAVRETTGLLWEDSNDSKFNQKKLWWFSSAVSASPLSVKKH